MDKRPSLACLKWSQCGAALLEKALHFYEKFLLPEGDDPSIRLEAGRAYRRVGEIRRFLGQNDGASEAYRSSIELLDRLVASRPADLDYRRELAESHVCLGASLSTTGKKADAESEYRQAILLRQDLLEHSSGDPDDLLAWAIAQGKLGTLLFGTGRLGEAREFLHASGNALDRLIAEFPSKPRYQSYSGGILHDLALVLLAQEDLIGARALFQRASTHQDAALKVDPQNTRNRLFARNHQEMLAVTLMHLGEHREAEPILRRCVSIGEALAADFPLVASYREDLAGSYGNLAELLMGMGPDRREEAIQINSQALKLFQALAVEHPGVPQYRRDVAFVRNNLAEVFLAAHRWKDAEQMFRGSVELGEALVAADPANAAYRKDLAAYKENLAVLLAVRPDLPVHNPAQAMELAQDATRLAPEKASHWTMLGLADYRMGNWKGSIDAMEEAVRRSKVGKLDPLARIIVAMADWRLGQKDAARAAFNLAIAEMAKNETQDEPTIQLRAEAAALLGLSNAMKPLDKESNHSK